MDDTSVDRSMGGSQVDLLQFKLGEDYQAIGTYEHA
jgi:hypothetical protein